MRTPQERLNAIIAELKLQAVDKDTCVGEWHGVPMTMTVLSSDPFALMFGFSVPSEGGQREEALAEFEDVADSRMKFRFDATHAWLSLYNLNDLPDEVVTGVLDHATATLSAHGLRPPEGCIHCGSQDDVRLLSVEGRPLRRCGRCLLAPLPAPPPRKPQPINLGALARLPIGFFGLIVCWGVFWTLVDVVLDYFRVRVFFLDNFTIALLIFAAGAVGYFLGMPFGRLLSRTGLPRWFRLPVGAFGVAGAVVLGEILYLTILMYRSIGVIDPRFAAHSLVDIVSEYTTFWKILKGGLAATTLVIAMANAQEGPAEHLD